MGTDVLSIYEFQNFSQISDSSGLILTEEIAMII